MNWSGYLEVVIAGGVGILGITLFFYGGHIIMSLLGDDTTVQKSGPVQSEPSQPLHPLPDCAPVTIGEERLATRLERDAVNEMVESRRAAPVGEPDR
jgi:hypothetical protein